MRSGYRRTLTLGLGGGDEDAVNATVAPGARELTVTVHVTGPSRPLVADGASSYVELVDSDTGELLRRVTLSQQQHTLLDGGRFVWSLVVEDVR